MKKFFSLTILLILSGCAAKNNLSPRQEFFSCITANPDAAITYIKDKDPEIRRYALYCIIKNNPDKAFDIIAEAVKDSNEQVRLTAVSALSSMLKSEKRTASLLQDIAKNETSEQIRKIAVQSTWPFHREIKLLRNDPTWDYEVKTVKSISLVNLPWRFTADPLQHGHLKGFFKKNFNVSKWKNIKMGTWAMQWKYSLKVSMNPPGSGLTGSISELTISDLKGGRNLLLLTAARKFSGAKKIF